MTRDEFMCPALWLELDIWAFGSLKRSSSVAALQNLTLFSTTQQAKDAGWEVFSSLGAMKPLQTASGNHPAELNWTEATASKGMGSFYHPTRLAMHRSAFKQSIIGSEGSFSDNSGASFVMTTTPLVLEFFPVLF